MDSCKPPGTWPALRHVGTRSRWQWHRGATHRAGLAGDPSRTTVPVFVAKRRIGILRMTVLHTQIGSVGIISRLAVSLDVA